MKDSFIYILIFLGFLSFETTISGQIIQPEYEQKKPSVAVIARSMGDSILIRWAPDDPVLWHMGNKYGYRLIRTKVSDDKNLLWGEQRITIILGDSIRPYKINEIEPYAEIDRYSAIVGQAIYGEDFEVTASFEKNPAEALDQSRDLMNRFSFALFSADQSLNAARIHGLWFTDKNIENKATYLYSVFPLTPKGGIDFDTAFVAIAVNDTAQLPQPYDLNVTFGDKYAELSWNREYLQRYYTSYIVERSDDNGSTFKRTSESPFLNIVENDHEGENIYKVDSLPENNKLYLFRIKGISPFGEIGPPSETVSGMGVDKSDFLNPIITHNEISEDVAIIEWEMPEESVDDISGFEISKSSDSEGPFDILTPDNLDKNRRNYTDPNPLKTGFYRVASVDKKGEKHYSFPAMVLMPDSIAPPTPLNFSGNADSAGIVTFSWDACNDTDLAGYRIYRSNYSSDGYVKVNTDIIRSTSFRDTLSLRTLSRKVFYKLSAIDNHFNESDFTNVLFINRPDTIHPAAPCFSKYAVSDNGIMLGWHRSPSTDVETHILYRQKAGDIRWDKIIAITDTSRFYFDTTDTEPVVYTYRIIARDSSGLDSEPSKTISLRAIGDEMKLQIPDIKAIRESDGKAIRLILTGPVNSNHKIAIYRSIDVGLPVLYRTVSGTEKSFTDINVNIGTNYTYMLQIITSEGKRSKPGPPITIGL